MTKGDGIPEGLFAFFQMMFALITTAILTGSVAGRMRFSDFSIYRDLVGRGLLSNGTHGLGRRLP